MKGANHKRKITNILWDTDGISVDDLPEEVEIEADIPADEIADYLSDSYGWCIKSFRIHPGSNDDII